MRVNSKCQTSNGVWRLPLSAKLRSRRAPGLERTSQFHQPDELGTVAVLVLASMLPGERDGLFPRCQALEFRAAEQHPELGNGRCKPQVCRHPLRSVANRELEELARLPVRRLVSHLDVHQ